METAGPAPDPSQLPSEKPAAKPSAVPVHSMPPSEAEPRPVPSASPMPAVAPTEPLNHESGPPNSHRLVNGNRPHEVYHASEPHLDFDSKIIGEDLDDLLDNVTHEQTTEVQPPEFYERKASLAATLVP